MAHKKFLMVLFSLVLEIRPSLSNSLSLKGILKPKNLRVASYNLNAILKWDVGKEVTTVENGTDVYKDEIVLYTVKYDIEQVWYTMPGCRMITRRSCSLSYYSPSTNIYKVFTHFGNVTIGTRDFKTSPYLYESLYPPNFTLSLNGSDVVISITEVPKLNWNGMSLYQYLLDKNYLLQYDVQFWIVFKNFSSSPNRTKTFEKVELEEFSFPVKKEAGDSICVRLKLKGLYSFKNENWSASQCITEPFEDVMNIFSSVGIGLICLFLLSLVPVGIIIKQKVRKFMKKARGPMPKELQKLKLELKLEFPDRKSFADEEMENVTIYQPTITEDKSFGTEINSGQHDVSAEFTPHQGSCKNKYVTNQTRLLSGSSLPRVALEQDNYVSDYVSVPSPDSGIGVVDF